GRSNARGDTSGTISGKRALSAAGGAPEVSVVGQTRIAPFVLRSSKVSHDERSGAASKNSEGRLGAPIAIRAAVRGSPATIGSGAPRRRWELSSKNCAIARAGWVMFSAIPIHRSADMGQTGSRGRTKHQTT